MSFICVLFTGDFGNYIIAPAINLLEVLPDG